MSDVGGSGNIAAILKGAFLPIFIESDRMAAADAEVIRRRSPPLQKISAIEIDPINLPSYNGGGNGGDRMEWNGRSREGGFWGRESKANKASLASLHSSLSLSLSLQPSSSLLLLLSFQPQAAPPPRGMALKAGVRASDVSWVSLCRT